MPAIFSDTCHAADLYTKPRSNCASIEESALVCGVASESYWLALSAASRMDPAKRARRRVAGCASSAGFTADNLLSRPTAMRPAQKPAGWRSASRCRFKRLWYSAQFAISSRPSLGNRGGLKMDKILSSRFIAFYHAASAASFRAFAAPEPHSCWNVKSPAFASGNKAWTS